MTKNQIKLLTIAAFVFPLLALVAISRNSAVIVSAAEDTPETIYATKCKACHGPTAAKFYNADVAIEEQAKIIMEGKKTEKPPAMPAYKEKGIDTVEKATALANYMKTLHNTPPATE